MLDFYQRIRELGPDSRNIAMTILDGPYAGEKALVSDGKVVWCLDEQGLLAGPDGGLGQEAGADRGQDGMPGQQTGPGPGDIRATGIYSIGGSQVFCEILTGEKKMVICGGGHVSIPIIQISRMLGFPVHVLEDRPLFADNARRAGATEVTCLPFDQGLARIPGDKDTFFVIVTRGHRYDQICLEAIARKDHAYIGMIGSRKRVAMVKETVIANGADPQVIQGLHSPIGLDIGAETPEEIGVAVMAEIIQVKNRQRPSGGFTREILDGILKAGDQELPRVLATIVARRGSAPRQTGTRMLVQNDGTCIGTIGGGCAESAILREALAMIRSAPDAAAPPGRIFQVDLTGQDAEDQGMVCGGTMEVLLEYI